MNTDPAARRGPQPRNPFLMFVFMLITMNIYWVIWLYNTYADVRAHSASATTVTPGKAVGYLFIPFFNIYWYFRIAVDYPRAIRRMQVSDPPTGGVLNNGLVTLLEIAVLPINIALQFALTESRLASYLLAAVVAYVPLLISQIALNGHWRAHQIPAAGNHG